MLVLALGIGANSAMFTFDNALLLRPLAGKADELVGLYSHDRTKPESSYRGFAYANYVDIRDGNDVFESLMAHTFSMVGVPAGDTTRQTFIEVVSANYFDALGAPLAAGRAFTLEEERPSSRIPVVIVPYQRANLLGQTIKVNAIDFTVVGVAPRGFTGTMALISPEMWLPLGMFDVVVNDIFKNNGSGLAGSEEPVARPGGTVEAGTDGRRRRAAARHAVAAARTRVSGGEPRTAADGEPAPAARREHVPLVRPGPGWWPALLMALSGVVLLIACLNIANMLLARGAARRKEIAIRLAVGGGRGRIVRQLLTEGLLLALAGAAGGLLLASWATGALAQSLAGVLPLGIAFEPKPDAMVIAATTAFAVIATVMSGLGPALKLSKTDLVADLKALGRRRIAGARGGGSPRAT